MIILNGIPPSLSDTYYDLPEKWGKPFWFILFISWTLCAMILSASPFMFWGSFGIALVGTAPLFRDESIKPVHFFGAFLSAIMSFIYITVELRLFYISIIYVLLMLLTMIFVKRNKTYWLEMICFASTFYALYLVI